MVDLWYYSITDTFETRPLNRKHSMTSMSGFAETTRLTAPTVPLWAVRLVTREMEESGVPVNQSAIVMFGIGRAIGIPDDKLAEFLDSRNRRPANSLDDFLASIDTEEVDA